jgi:hypothetical protein
VKIYNNFDINHLANFCKRVLSSFNIFLEFWSESIFLDVLFLS